MAEVLESPVFDAKAYITQRNQGITPEKPIPTPAEPAKVEPKAAPVAKEEEPHKLPRSVRREINRLREEAAEARGRLAAYEELRAKPAEAKPTAAVETEPQRENFNTDLEFMKATAKWEAKQYDSERQKQTTQQQSDAEFTAHVSEMHKKFREDIPKIAPNWKELVAAADHEPEEDDFETPEAFEEAHDNWKMVQYNPAEQPILQGLIDSSEVMAHVMLYFVEHPKEFRKLLDLNKNPGGQIRLFARLEERAEKLYSKEEAAQAPEPEKAKKDRTHLAEAPKAAGRNPETIRLPKPSSEISARGGSPPPEAPIPGSKAWMDMRNRMERRY